MFQSFFGVVNLSRIFKALQSPYSLFTDGNERGGITAEDRFDN